MLGGRPLQQMEADHGMLCGRLILRTHKQQNPSRRSEGFSFVGPDTAKSTDAFCAMSLLFLQLGHGAQRRDWLAGHLGFRTAESVRALSNWNPVTTSPE